MEAQETARGSWGLVALIQEASLALGRLDVRRLSELAATCEVLNREVPLKIAEDRKKIIQEIREATGEMKILSQILDATRGNLRVMQRLRALRMSRIEYTEGQARGWAVAGAGDGDD